MKIPARTKGSFFVRVQNFEAAKGYVPHVSHKRVSHDALVTNNNGKAYLYLTNTTEKDIEVAVPVIIIEPYEELLNTNSGEELYINSLTEPIQENDRTKMDTNTELFNGQNQLKNPIYHENVTKTWNALNSKRPTSYHYPTSYKNLILAFNSCNL